MDNEINKDHKDIDLDSLVSLYNEAVEEQSKTEELKEEPVIEKPKAEAKPKPKAESKAKKDEDDTVAIFAEGNMYQGKWGELSKGYNIVKKEAADFWLAHRTVRKATPEEVAKHFGVK